VWDACIALCGYLIDRTDEVITMCGGHAPAHVVEIGAGCGLLSVVASKCMPTSLVWATDLAPEIEVTQHTIECNDMGARVRAREFDWGCSTLSQDMHVDLVIGSDVVYEIQNFNSLIKALSMHGNTRALLSVERRWKDVHEWWLEDLSRHGWHVHVIPPTTHWWHECDAIDIVWLTRDSS